MPTGPGNVAPTLRKLKLFAGFREQELWEVLRVAAWEQFAAGQALSIADDVGHSLRVVVSSTLSAVPPHRGHSRRCSGVPCS